jgi:hypothetical protein
MEEVMRYSYFISKSSDFRVKSKEFPDVIGIGRTEDEAFGLFLTRVFSYIRNCLKNDLLIPKEYSAEKNRVKTFGLPLNMAMKLKLHNLMLTGGITKSDMARLLAIVHSEVPSESWDLETLKKVEPEAQPKYKKVQRIFDIDHESTVREIEHAYRVLGFNVEVNPYKRKS